ncbi:MAG TPA: zf-HC2 domain-containing protein [Pyrinomonadaceae bacterium]|jgi:hypothetical protein
MRCEDCLPLIEEYFDGEVAEAAAARMGAHLASCETCAAALDALSFETEIYARYDRGGLEVAPDLWSRVSAEIARGPRPAAAPERRPFLSRARAGFAAALVALTSRPALASSFALALFAVTAGSLWLARRESPNAPAEVALNTPAAKTAAGPAADGGTDGEAAPAPRSLNAGTPEEGHAAAAPSGAKARMTEAARATAAGAPGKAAAAAGAEGEDAAEALLASAVAPPQSPNVVTITADEHAQAADDAALIAAGEPVAAGGGARPLDMAESEVARHVEQTQMLLRSIKNARASEMGTLDIAYEKSLSRKLLAENSTLKLEADVKGDKQTRQVLDQIEPFLLDIANLRENPSREEVRSIRERVRKDEIVAALQVY